MTDDCGGFQTIFRDAAPEFASVAAIAHKMEGWKRSQPDSYRDTYVSLQVMSFPRVFSE